MNPMDVNNFISLENEVTISIKHIHYGLKEIEGLDGSFFRVASKD